MGEIVFRRGIGDPLDSVKYIFVVKISKKDRNKTVQFAIKMNYLITIKYM